MKPDEYGNFERAMFESAEYKKTFSCAFDKWNFAMSELWAKITKPFMAILGWVIN